MRIEVYKDNNKAEWDAFVHQSKNGTFLFYRDFIEYHADRFTDQSFLFYDDKDRLIGLLPGNRDNDVYHSHQGLTYGGLVLSDKATAAQVLDMFGHLKTALKGIGVSMLIYKAVPHIYHRYPAEEDLYALFRNNAQLMVRNLSSTIILSNSLPYSRLRSRGMKKAADAGLIVKRSVDIDIFWSIVTNNMQTKYGVSPIHNLDEIIHLMNNFPNNIQLLVVENPLGQMLGGCLNFMTHTVIHAQYAAATKEGKKCGALDLLIDNVLSNSDNKIYFDFGISNEENGQILNEKLIFQKEGFGARGIAYDTYILSIE